MGKEWMKMISKPVLWPSSRQDILSPSREEVEEQVKKVKRKNHLQKMK